MTLNVRRYIAALAFAGAHPVDAQVAVEESVDTARVSCMSSPGERRECPARTAGGVELASSTGPGACELGRTWGFDEAGVWVAEGCGGEFTLGVGEEAQRFANYVPTAGFKVAESDKGDLNIRVFTYVQYLNQSDLDDSYTDAFGLTRTIQQRKDFQVNKAQVYFYGWVMTPKLRYQAYVWSSNASQGRDAQVVVAGNFNYTVSDRLTVGAGIAGLPGVRSTGGSFPYWLSVDSRQIADEYFRPSYTTGVWAKGNIAPGFGYELMLGNNLSQLGVDAGQLDSKLDTWSGGLSWMPTTGEFGTASGFGDYDRHEELATRFGLRYTQSDENRIGQPDTFAFENVLMRISDGSVIFATDLFGPGIRIDDVVYRMAALEAGIKYRGYSLEFEYYRRRLDEFAGSGLTGLTFDELNDDGYQLQASAMLRPEVLQVYFGGSQVFGEYGDPWDVRAGINWFPWKNQVLRWNFEIANLERSPVGSLAAPYPVGASGYVFRTAFMLWL